MPHHSFWLFLYIVAYYFYYSKPVGLYIAGIVSRVFAHTGDLSVINKFSYADLFH